MSDPSPLGQWSLVSTGQGAATHAALWAVDEAVNRDIPLRLVYVIDPSQLSAAGEGGGQSAASGAAPLRKVEATGQPVKIETEVLCGRPPTKLMCRSPGRNVLCASVRWGLDRNPAVARGSVRGGDPGWSRPYAPWR